MIGGDHAELMVAGCSNRWSNRLNLLGALVCDMKQGSGMEITLARCLNKMCRFCHCDDVMVGRSLGCYSLTFIAQAILNMSLPAAGLLILPTMFFRHSAAQQIGGVTIR